MIKIFFTKTILFSLVAVLGVASLPVFSVSALGSNDPTPPPQRQVTNERLERIWARQLRMYERMGKADEFIERVQKLIDRASANGKDVSAVQSALDAFESAWKDAKPIYESMNGIVNSHQGFGEDGKVTDPEKAKETIRSMHEKMQEIKMVMNGTGQALREAIQAFREANPRPEKTPKP
jgi:hypothetical protein